MNFKFKTFSLLCAGLALGFTACNNDDLLEGGQKAEGDGTYFHVRAGITTPTMGGTRSATDDDEFNSDAEADNETPYDFENEIRTLILVYANANNEYITHSVVKGITKAPVNGAEQNYYYDVVGEIAHENLEKAYKEGALKDYNPDTDDVHVFAICNYTANLESKFNDAIKNNPGAEWVNWVGTINEVESPVHSPNPTIDNTIWAKRSFLMNNYQIANVKFPATIDDWDEYTDKSTPWILNSDGTQEKAGGQAKPIIVERNAARFDFKDGSDYANTDTPNRYDILLHENSYNDQEDPDKENSGDLNIVSIQLTRMALVNMSKNFYYLRRVTDYTNYANPHILLGKEFQRINAQGEKESNFVVDTDWAQKVADGGMAVGDESMAEGTEWGNFNFPLYKMVNGKAEYNRTGWYVDNISKVLDPEGMKDQWNSTPFNGAYHIWRYVTENTLPTAKSQVTGQSTGVVFKGKIIPGDGIEDARADDYVSQALVDALNDVTEKGPKGEALNLYSFEGRLFAGPEDIIAGAVFDGENSALYAAVNKVLSNWKLVEGKNEFSKEGTGKALTVKAYNEFGTEGAEYYGYKVVGGIQDEDFYTLNDPVNTQIAQYKAENVDEDGWGYYCFYFYWNRHNDNGKGGLMGDMEFATVRNNVYKLAVTKIARLGHPTIPGDDPDPEEPGKPDEPPTKYIEVQVEVLPWVVRENNIEF